MDDEAGKGVVSGRRRSSRGVELEGRTRREERGTAQFYLGSELEADNAREWEWKWFAEKGSLESMTGSEDGQGQLVVVVTVGAYLV
jgi:hypothetical protein